MRWFGLVCVQVVPVRGRVRAGQPASISTRAAPPNQTREDLRPSDVSRASTSTSCASTALTLSSSVGRARACDQGPSTCSASASTLPSPRSPLAGAPTAAQAQQAYCLTVAEATADAPARPISPCRHFFARRRVKQTQSHFARPPTARPWGLKHSIAA